MYESMRIELFSAIVEEKIQKKGGWESIITHSKAN